MNENTRQVVNNATNRTLLHPEEEEEDREHLRTIITALRYYRKYSSARVNKRENYLCSLPKCHQHMLAKYRAHLGVLRDCIDANQAVINEMLRDEIPCSQDAVDDGEISFTPKHKNNSDQMRHRICNKDMENSDHADHVEPFKILKTQTILKLMARDWSADGAEEREQSYTPIINTIEEYFKPTDFNLSEVKILVPGAGLGRLCYDISCRGYFCEGNEFSLFMLIASNFVLNKSMEENKYTLYPWIHQSNNNLCMSDQVAPIQFPDICPVKNPPKGKIVMAAGDFLDVYKDENFYDCVATCFFIDCANNIVEFIETIYNILVPGGIWVNLGPLLYHYADIPGENSIEPTYENLVTIIEMVGFEIIKKESGIRTKYAQNPRSMVKSEYESLFWVCRKPLHSPFTHSDNQNHDMNNGNNDKYSNGHSMATDDDDLCQSDMN